MTSDVLIATDHGDVPLRSWSTDGGGDIGILVAHGAGAGHDHPWIAGLCQRLAVAGLDTWSFEYAYMAAGRKAPDRLPKLLDVHEVVAGAVAPQVDRLIVAGKSMGGRVGGHLVAEGRVDAAGLVYLGYPLVPLGKAEARDTRHLDTVVVPQLFVSGTRDRMGPIDLVEAVARGVPDGRLVTMDDGDHSLVPRKASGRTVDDALDATGVALAAWVSERVA